MTNPRPSPGAQRPVALITGAARRVGLASARALARSGCDIVLTFNRSAAEAEAACAQLRSLGVRATAEHLPLEDLDGVDRRAAVLAAKLRVSGGLDVLVHNASIYDRAPLPSLTPADLTRAFAVNAAAPLLLSRALEPLLSASARPGGGSIVAMCDIHAMGEHGLPRRRDFVPYAMSKAALAEMVRSLARELAPRVRVNGVAPGVVAWPESGHESDSAAQESYLRSVPLARAGTPEDAAEAVRWLALDAAYLTGEIIRVDGGRTMV